MDSFLKAQHRQHYNIMRLYFRISLTHRGSPSTFVAIPAGFLRPFRIPYYTPTQRCLFCLAAQHKAKVKFTILH